MFDHTLFARELEASCAVAAKGPLDGAMRAAGLRLVVEADSQGAVEAALAKFSPRFEVERLFPDEVFEGDSGAWAWGDRFYVAVAGGASFEDVSVAPWDLAHAVREAGGFDYVAPERHRLQPGWADTVDEAGDEAGDEAVGEVGNWALEQLRAPQAWRHTSSGMPGYGVQIAQIDTGWVAHEIWDPHGGQPSNLVTDFQRNFVPGEGHYDARDREGEYYGHGLRTASVMVAPQVKGRALMGVVYSARVVPIRAMASVVLTPLSTPVVRALRYATELATDHLGVISMSFGGVPPRVMLQAIGTAFKANKILVAASGQGRNNTNLPGWVAVYPALDSRVFGVAGSAPGDEEWEPSSWFPTWPHRSVHASAPAGGVRVATTGGRSNYTRGYGTSYSAAYVAGVAAMWLSKHFRSGYRGDQPATWRFRDAAHRLARRAGFGDGRWGIVDAEKLMTEVPKDAPLDAAEQAALGRLASCTGLLEMLLAGPNGEGEGARRVAALIGVDEGAGEMYAEELLDRLTEPGPAAALAEGADPAGLREALLAGEVSAALRRRLEAAGA